MNYVSEGHFRVCSQSSTQPSNRPNHPIQPTIQPANQASNPAHHPSGPTGNQLASHPIQPTIHPAQSAIQYIHPTNPTNPAGPTGLLQLSQIHLDGGRVKPLRVEECGATVDQMPDVRFHYPSEDLCTVYRRDCRKKGKNFPTN